MPISYPDFRTKSFRREIGSLDKLTIHRIRCFLFFVNLVIDFFILSLRTGMHSISTIIIGLVVIASAKPFLRNFDCNAQQPIISDVCKTYALMCCDSTSWIMLRKCDHDRMRHGHGTRCIILNRLAVMMMDCCHHTCKEATCNDA